VPTPSTTRDDRIELRASREQKRLLAAAAGYERLDLTPSFVMRTALPAAEKIVAKHERIVLTHRDSLRVLELLEHPPKPTDALRRGQEAAAPTREQGTGLARGGIDAPSLKWGSVGAKRRWLCLSCPKCPS